MAIPSWYDGAWDVTRLAGRLVPGHVVVDVKLKASTDRQKATGKRKSRSRDKGDEQAAVSISVTLTPDELDAFKDLIPHLDPGRRKGVRDPIPIENPNAALWGVQAITIDEIDSPSPQDGNFWEIVISAKEWTADAAADKAVKPGAKKPIDEDTAAWLPFVDDEAAGTSVPSQAGAEDGLGL